MKAKPAKKQPAAKKAAKPAKKRARVAPAIPAKKAGKPVTKAAVKTATAGKKAKPKKKPARKAVKPPAPEQPKKIGRPSDFTPELAAAICARLETGESLRSVCKGPEMPDRNTVSRWLEGNEDFRRQYARAKEDGIDAILEEAERIADDMTRDVISGGEFGDKPNTAAVARAKLRVDFRRWKASKLDPKRYGDKVQVSGDEDAPVKHQIVATPETLAAIQAAAAAAMRVEAPAEFLKRCGNAKPHATGPAGEEP